MNNITSQWFTSWFDSPYYHILYKNRDFKEAKRFMYNLSKYLNLPKDAKILDLACGKGRHSIYLNSLGYDVLGVDLSKNNIAHAKAFENNSLKFKVHDMRKPMKQQFDAVFNLFTSFGYFENDEDNLKTIKAIKANLKSSGVGVIDFMNTENVIKNLIPEDNKIIDGINFCQKRYIDNGYLVKEITFTDKGQTYAYDERVKALTLEDFNTMFNKVNIELLDIFGDYDLGEFYHNASSRLIMIFK